MSSDLTEPSERDGDDGCLARDNLALDVFGKVSMGFIARPKQAWWKTRRSEPWELALEIHLTSVYTLHV